MEAVLEKSQAVVLHNISWDSYKTIADALHDETAAHFTFDRGQLEIMVLSLKHENFKKILAMLFERLCEALEVEIFAAGSTTFQRKDLERGFEPDECYYVANAERMRGRESVDLAQDPPPDLTVEVDIKHSSLDRLSIFAAVGIPEVWRYDGANLTIYTLSENVYEKSPHSRVLPGAATDELERLIDTGKNSTRREFLAHIEDYARRIKS